MGVSLELEVQALGGLLDGQRFIVGLVLENQLLKEQESPLVVDPLANLHLARPQVGRVGLLAVVALLVMHHKLHCASGLQLGVVLHLLGNHEL